ncbi:hypothetical protein CL634_07865 [bacterium]|nr:hypothetical protein [bacterium]
MEILFIQFTSFDTAFRLRPPFLPDSAYIFLIVLFVGFITLGIISQVIASKKKDDRLVSQGWKRINRMGWTIGLLGLLHTFFMFERATVVSMPAIFPGLLLIALIWLVSALKYFRTVPGAKAARQAVLAKKKYMP